ncbi:hypothetical protein BSKO_13527 [Bryopsis sp. KO-2023]|nr:hypothetical protein BSKO_13527 [Bryopsis sp. KO-2023]
MLLEVGMAWLPVLACVVLQTMLGAVWYGPIAGQYFMKLAFDHGKPKDSPKAALASSIVMAALVTLILSWVINKLQIETLEGGLALAFILWAVDFCLNFAHHQFEERPFLLFIIHSFYHMLCLVTVCGVLTIH